MKSTLPLALGVIAMIVIFCLLWHVGASQAFANAMKWMPS